MDAPEAANPIAPPSPSHSEESLEFSYIEELPPTKPDTPLHYTPFSDAPKPDVPFERGLQIRSCEAGASYTDYSPYQHSSELTDQANSALLEKLIRSLLSEMEGPRCDLESLNPINIADLPKGQSTLENLHSAVDYSQHEIRYQNSKPKADIETELMQGHLVNFATVASNPNEQLMLRRSSDYDLDPMTGNVDSHLRKMPAITSSSYMNNACTPPRQTSQSNSALSSLDLSTSRHSHQMSSFFETPQRDLHHSQDIWIDQNRSNKKRRKRAPLGEGAGCKNCKCKKANCLKRYCKCFALGKYCMGSCLCQNCYNRPTHEDKVIAARKVDPSKTPASTGHIRGCNCKKSKCKKNYCECYENGVPCSIKCRCTGCNNPYGNDSCYSELGPKTGTQINESCETLMAENVSHPNSTASSPTPAWADSSNASLGGSSKKERPSNFDIPDASEFYASQRLNESSNILHNQLNVEDNFRSNPELQMPNIQQVGDGSSTTYIINPCFVYTNNSSNSAREMIHYHSSPPFPSATSLQHPTPDANPTIPGYSELGPETGTQINESCETLMAENVSHPNSTASSPTPSCYRSNASLGGSSRRKRPCNFDIPDASGFDARRRINETINIFRSRLNFEDDLESSPELQMPNIHQVGDGSSTTCINNSSNSARDMIHYHSSLVFPSASSLQLPTPDANPTIPGNFLQHRK